MKYYCFRCGHKFLRISNLKRHTNRKKPCHSIYMNIPYETLLEEYNDHLHDFLTKKKNLKYQQNNSKILKKLLGELLDNKQKMHQLENKTNEENTIMDLESKIESLTNQINVINNNNNNINNGNINNGHIGDNKIIINNFGEEKYNLTAQDCESIMSNDFNMVVKLIEKIHFDTEENRNIYVRSLKEKYAGIFVDQKWNIVEREQLIEDLVCEKNLLLEKLLDEHEEEFTYVRPKRVKAIIDICRNDPEEIKNVRSGVRKMMKNRNDEVLETYKESYQEKRIKLL